MTIKQYFCSLLLKVIQPQPSCIKFWGEDECQTIKLDITNKYSLAPPCRFSLVGKVTLSEKRN